MSRSRFGIITLMVVSPGTAFQGSNCGWAQNCKMMLQTTFPGLPYDVFNRPDIIQMMDQVDNVTGTLYIIDPVEGEPLLANSTIEGLEEEYKQWTDCTSQ